MTSVASDHELAAEAGAYARLTERSRKIRLLGGCQSLLGWDQETYMPPGGLANRGEQMALLASLSHEMFTDPAVGDWLAECEADDALGADPLSVEAVNLRELRRDYDRATKLPGDLVAALSRATSAAKARWAEARKQSDFAAFQPSLEEILRLLRRKAECYGWPDDGEPWDALAEGFEPQMTAARIEALFTPLRQRLVDLLNEVTANGQPPDERLVALPLPVEAQQAFARMVAERIGFDFSRGRLDVSTHPFCSGTHCHDVRMTTRFGKDNLPDALGSTMHESGHGMYEQGLPCEYVGAPMGQSVSLSIHESQSRMWENQVGRSFAFWRWAYPKLGEYFGGAVDGLTLEQVYGACNRVKPDFVRVEADELTYNLHIMIRFELERAMLRGDLAPADLPGAWNEKYEQYLNITPPNDAKGCLQDIHWSMGAMGYFPTYTLGNLYAAQFFDAASQALPDLDASFAAGDFAPLLGWLREKIHSQGKRYRPEDLCEVVTGKPLSADPLMDYLSAKLRAVYRI